eukprot:4042409-Amphidinium_carterae.1
MQCGPVFKVFIVGRSVCPGKKGDADYVARAAHVELAEKLRKRDPRTAPRAGDCHIMENTSITRVEVQLRHYMQYKHPWS